MDSNWNIFYQEIIKNKKIIVLFTTLVNVSCLIYYLFTRFFPTSNTSTGTPPISVNIIFIIIVSVAVVNLLICFGFIHLWIKEKKTELEDRIQNSNNAIDSAFLLTELDKGNIVSSKLYCYEYVTNIEKGLKKGDEIWCVSSDIEEDAKNEDLRRIIFNNLKKGVSYKYFISPEGKTISEKARWGKNVLMEYNAKYNKRLLFFDIKEELIVPDLDIIIYNASDINKRIGYVCIEIGDDQDKYVYQQISKTTLQGICDILQNYFKNKKKYHPIKKIVIIAKKALVYFIDHLSILYFILSTGGLALLSFTKIVSWKGALLFLSPSIIETIVTAACAMCIIMYNSRFNDLFLQNENDEQLLANIVNHKDIKPAIEKLKAEKIQELMKKKDLGDANSIFKIDDTYSSIWILSDLSQDIGNYSFYKWLNDTLHTYNDLNCFILYPQGSAATVGRNSKIKKLENEYKKRVKNIPLNDIDTHYIWSTTHGIIFFESDSLVHRAYVSLQSEKRIYYKEVIIEEKESATLLGRLNILAGI